MRPSINRNPHIGSSLDDFLHEDGILEELQIQALKEVVAWHLDQAMKKQHPNCRDGVATIGLADSLPAAGGCVGNEKAGK